MTSVLGEWSPTQRRPMNACCFMSSSLTRASRGGFLLQEIKVPNFCRLQPRHLWLRAIARRIVVLLYEESVKDTSAKNEVTKLSLMVNTVLYSRQWHCAYSILCYSRVCGARFSKFEYGRHIVHMAKNFRPDNPTFTPCPHWSRLAIYIHVSSYYSSLKTTNHTYVAQ